MLLAEKFLENINVQGFWAAFWAVIIFSLTTHIISKLNGSKN
jgi:uncharacterized membrane protein YvlD (DUF360 family)